MVKVMSTFNCIIQIMKLQTRLNLPGGIMCVYSVLSGSLLTERVSCSYCNRASSYYQLFVCAKV